MAKGQGAHTFALRSYDTTFRAAPSAQARRRDPTDFS